MENTYTFSFLNAAHVPVLRQTFLDAFADYFLPLQMSEEQFRTKLAREGVEPRFSGGVFYGEKLIGFILTGIGEWHGLPTAYNAGTGVLPAHRGHGLIKKLYRFMFPKLREIGIEQCLLEVIQENTPAIKTYEAVGFRMTRALDCFRAKKSDMFFSSEPSEKVTLKETLKPDWKAYHEFHDIEPSWQNRQDAVKKSLDKKVFVEAHLEGGLLVGYIVFFPNTGAIAQMAVSSAYCGRGIGTALLREAAQRTEATALLLNNVDSCCKDFLSFMERRSIKRFLRQNEMLLQLNEL